MPRTPKQMAAIVMALKKKGLWRRLFGGGAQASLSVGRLSRAKIALAGKQIPLATSPKVAKALWGKHFSSSALRSYLGKVPRKHVQESSLKGIYALDNFEFNRVMGGILRRTHTPEEISQFRKAVKAPVFDILSPGGPKPRVLGVQQHGRIFLNAEAITDQADSMKKLNPQFKLTMQSQVRKSIARHVVLHEFGHHVDNPAMRFTAAAKGEAAIAAVKTKSTSGESLFFKTLTGKPIERASVEDRVYAIEQFADLYSGYIQHPLILRLTSPQGYRAIKLFFEGK